MFEDKRLNQSILGEVRKPFRVVYTNAPARSRRSSAEDNWRRSLGPTPDRAGAIVELVQGPCQPARVLLAPADPFELQPAPLPRPGGRTQYLRSRSPLTCRIGPPAVRERPMPVSNSSTSHRYHHCHRCHHHHYHHYNTTFTTTHTTLTTTTVRVNDRRTP